VVERKTRWLRHARENQTVTLTGVARDQHDRVHTQGPAGAAMIDGE
jgi:hypothetical protein